MGWLRIKRRVSGSLTPEFYAQKTKELDGLKKQEQKGEIEIRYVDESSFCLIPFEPNRK